MKAPNKHVNLITIINEIFVSLVTVISPTLNTKIRYKQMYKKSIDLDHPQTLSEKISWLKLNIYGSDPLVIKCADKYRVREYVKDCGYESILIDLYGVYDDVDDIDWKTLPNQFVLKWNFGSGFNAVCRNKAELDINKTKRQLKFWGMRKFWLHYAEMQYKYIPRKIICERLLLDDSQNGAITDYKVYCFNGKPLAILIMGDRAHDIKSAFFDVDWHLLENTDKYLDFQTQLPRPINLNYMIEAAKDLSVPFPFVRCDFYIANDKLYFGELTFTPSAGINTAQTKIGGKDMADFIDIEALKKKQ